MTIEMKWWTVAGLMGGSVVAGLIARAILSHLFQKIFRRTETKLDDALYTAVRPQVLLWFVLAGVVLSLRILAVNDQWNDIIYRAVVVLFILSLASALSRLLVAFLPYLARRLSMSLPATSLTNNLVQIFVFFLAVLVILSNLGISIGPMLAALGVGSLAVGLALQETLSNLFAGFYLLISREISVGDEIELERGAGYGVHKGRVLDIKWRSSRLEMENGYLTVVPNSFMTQSIITIFNKPPPAPKTPPPAATQQINN